jgi:hypothetical protein
MSETEYEGLVLLFNTSAKAELAARLHAQSCPMVNTARARNGRVKVSLIEDGIADEILDLTERGFPVLRCKCCK